MKIFIVGSGKLANAIVYSKLSFQSCEIAKWESKNEFSQEKSIIIHAGSGRQLQECVEFCTRTKSVFIELSTGLETENMEPDFPLIICPNTSLLVLKTLTLLKLNGKLFKNYEISITESHQSTKKTEPGTAYSFAKSLHFPIKEIVSVRKPEIQLHEIGIPQEFIEKHAYHKIVIKDGTDELTIETKVFGHDSYAIGVKKITESVLHNNFENKKYSIFDLINNNML